MIRRAGRILLNVLTAASRRGAVMPKLKNVTFRELDDAGGCGPSIRALRAETARPDEARVVAYLRAGVLLDAVLGVETDVIDPADETHLFQCEMTDGVWTWREDLAHYVGKYHLPLPPEFLAHMRANRWVVPPAGSMDPRLFG